MKHTIHDGRPFRFGVDYSLAGYKVVSVLDDSGSLVPLGVVERIEHVESTDGRDVWTVTVGSARETQ